MSSIADVFADNVDTFALLGDAPVTCDVAQNGVRVQVSSTGLLDRERVARWAGVCLLLQGADWAFSVLDYSNIDAPKGTGSVHAQAVINDTPWTVWTPVDDLRSVVPFLPDGTRGLDKVVAA